MKRATYLCELQGAPIEAETNTAMPSDFLMQQIEWREALDDAETLQGIERISLQLNENVREQLSKLEQLIDVQKDFVAASGQVRSLMFTERFASEIDARIDRLGQ